VWYNANMTNRLRAIINRIDNWPKQAQEEAVNSLLAIEDEYLGGDNLLPEDVIALERSGEDVRLGRFAGDHDVEGVLNKYRGA
jgi:predicted RNA-binding protein